MSLGVTHRRCTDHDGIGEASEQPHHEPVPFVVAANHSRGVLHLGKSSYAIDRGYEVGIDTRALETEGSTVKGFQSSRKMLP